MIHPPEKPGSVAAIAVLALLAALAVPDAARATPYVYSGGHSDIAVEYSGGMSFFLQFNFGINAVAENGTIASQLFAMDQVDVRVPDTTPPSTVPSDSAFSFLGATGGSTLWYLPQTSAAGKAFFGFGTYDVDPDAWVGNVTWSMIAASGPGQLSLWQTAGFGTPNPLFTTANGITASDSFQQITGGHDHYNWGFTATGLYQLVVQAQATHVADAGRATPYLVTGKGVVTFLVGSTTPIPIPGDVNHDQIVNGQDIALVASQWLAAGDLVVGDANGDAIVNGQDIALIASNWLATSAGGPGGSGAMMASVPEPQAIVLGSLGVLVLLSSSRRRRRASRRDHRFRLPKPESVMQQGVIFQ